MITLCVLCIVVAFLLSSSLPVSLSLFSSLIFLFSVVVAVCIRCFSFARSPCVSSVCVLLTRANSMKKSKKENRWKRSQRRRQTNQENMKYNRFLHIEWRFFCLNVCWCAYVLLRKHCTRQRSSIYWWFELIRLISRWCSRNVNRKVLTLAEKTSEWENKESKRQRRKVCKAICLKTSIKAKIKSNRDCYLVRTESE